MADDWNISNEDDNAWGEFFPDELDRERWKTNFGKDKDSAETASYWRDMVPGIEPSVATIYNKEKMTPYEIQDFHSAGITDYKEVLGWRRVNAQPTVATAFKEKGVNAETYEKWAKLGISEPDTMLRFSEDMKIDPSHLEKFIKPLVDEEKLELAEVPRWLEAGVELREIGDWIEAGIKYASLAAAWKKLHFQPKDAKEWERVLVHPTAAADWLAAGYKDIKDIASLIKQGYSTPKDVESEVNNVVFKMK